LLRPQHYREILDRTPKVDWSANARLIGLKWATPRSGGYMIVETDQPIEIFKDWQMRLRRAHCFNSKRELGWIV
jgi:hypothetical protein